MNAEEEIRKPTAGRWPNPHQRSKVQSYFRPSIRPGGDPMHFVAVFFRFTGSEPVSRRRRIAIAGVQVLYSCTDTEGYLPGPAVSYHRNCRPTCTDSEVRSPSKFPIQQTCVLRWCQRVSKKKSKLGCLMFTNAIDSPLLPFFSDCHFHCYFYWRVCDLNQRCVQFPPV